MNNKEYMLSTKEPKGTKDWLPQEFSVRKYIFDTWRKVCLRYGYEEYLTPLVESADIYRAKSGEDVGGNELMTFQDLGGRELSIRPEMTPSVTRLVSKIYASEPKPIKWFSIANFMRNEKPQRGRNREFWQLNCDIFGSSSIRADIEILQLSLDLVLEFNPPADSFYLGINSRELLEDLLSLAKADKLSEDKKLELIRILDKRGKISKQEFNDRLKAVGLEDEGISIINSFVACNNLDELLKSLPELEKSNGYKQIAEAITALKDLGYGDYLVFDPKVIRGFDYYNGLVFEVFDNNPDNSRAMFGGGRYNGLAKIFGQNDFPAVGVAPGDETFKLFLESWNLLDNLDLGQEVYYLPLLSSSLIGRTFNLATKLRVKGLNVISGFEEQKVGKALQVADKKGWQKVIIFGEDENKKNVYKLKDMLSGEEQELKIT